MLEIKSNYLRTRNRRQNALFYAGEEEKESFESNSNINIKCTLFVQNIQNILVPLHGQDAHGCQKWDRKQHGNKDPERFSLFQNLKREKTKTFSHHNDQRGESEKEIKDPLGLTVRNFFRGSVAPLTPGAVVQSAANLDRVRSSRTDAVHAVVGLFA